MRFLFTAGVFLAVVGCKMDNPAFEKHQRLTAGTETSVGTFGTTAGTTRSSTTASTSETTETTVSTTTNGSSGVTKTTTDGSTTSTTSSSTGVTSSSTSGPATSSSTTSTSGTTGVVLDVGAPGCLGPEDCAPTEFCDFPTDFPCGANNTAGTCKPRPQNCMPINEPVQGCDCQRYGNACEANKAGTDVACEGGAICC